MHYAWCIFQASQCSPTGPRRAALWAMFTAWRSALVADTSPLAQPEAPPCSTDCMPYLSECGHTAEASKGQLRRSRSTCMRGGDVGERECVECNSGIMQCKGYDAECGVHSGRFRAGPSPNPACLEGLHVLLCMSSVS